MTLLVSKALVYNMESSTAKTLLRLQVMLEQSIKLQCQIISEQDRLKFDQLHSDVLKEIEEQIKLLSGSRDN